MLFFSFFSVLLCVSLINAQSPLTKRTRVATGLPANYEPSGCAYHPRLKELFIAHDKSEFARVTEINGVVKAQYDLVAAGEDRFDTEGMVILNPTSDRVWMVNESPTEVIEYDFELRQRTRTFKLPDIPGATQINGLEGITFLPDPNNPEGGIFLVANSATGNIHKFQLPVNSAQSVAGTAIDKGTFSTVKDQPVTGLDYHVPNQLLYVLFGTVKQLAAYKVTVNSNDAVHVGTWDVEGDRLSGFCMNHEETRIETQNGQQVCIADAYFTEDHGPGSPANGVYKFEFEHTCPPNAVLKGAPTPAPALLCPSGLSCIGKVCRESAGIQQIVDKCGVCNGNNQCLAGGDSLATGTTTILSLVVATLATLALFA